MFRGLELICALLAQGLWDSDCGFGAGDGIRTRDINLGKVALYQLSYSREGTRTGHREGCRPAIDESSVARGGRDCQTCAQSTRRTSRPSTRSATPFGFGIYLIFTLAEALSSNHFEAIVFQASY